MIALRLAGRSGTVINYSIDFIVELIDMNNSSYWSYRTENEHSV